MRALIVDDDRAVRFVLKMILTHELGCEVAEASDGRQALDRLADGDYDLAVLDVHLPGMSGLDLLRIIRRSGKGAMRVVILTSDGRDDLVIEAARIGVEAYLVKPLDPEAAGKRLASVLSLSPSTGPGAREEPPTPPTVERRPSASPS